MIPTSAAYQEVTQAPHTAVCRVEVYINDVLVLILQPHEGHVEADRNAAVMRTFECKVSDPTGTLTPQGVADALAPFGTIIKIFRGVEIPTVSRVVDIDDTEADWAEGTLIDTVATVGGDLVLGAT